MDEWGHCTLHAEVVMTSGGGHGGPRRLLTAKTAGDDGDNVDEPRSRKTKSGQASQYTMNIMSDLQRFDFISVILVILTPRP